VNRLKHFYLQDPSNILLTKDNAVKLFNFGLGHITEYGKVKFAILKQRN